MSRISPAQIPLLESVDAGYTTLSCRAKIAHVDEVSSPLFPRALCLVIVRRALESDADGGHVGRRDDDGPTDDRERTRPVGEGEARASSARALADPAPVRPLPLPQPTHRIPTSIPHATLTTDRPTAPAG